MSSSTIEENEIEFVSVFSPVVSTSSSSANQGSNTSKRGRKKRNLRRNHKSEPQKKESKGISTITNSSDSQMTLRNKVTKQKTF